MSESRVPYNESAALSLLAYTPHKLLDEPWREELFLHPSHQLLFRLIEQHYAASLPTDLISLTSALDDQGKLEEIGGPGLLTGVLLTFGCGNPLQTAYYLDVLEETLLKRRTLQAAQLGLHELRKKLITPAELAERITTAAAPHRGPSRSSLADQIADLRDELTNTEPPEAVPTGLAHVDRHLRGGFLRGDFGVVAGGTSSGKSVLLGMAALRALQAGWPTVIFSLEMSAGDVLRRLASDLCGHPVRGEADRDRVSSSQLEATQRALDELSRLPLRIVDDLSELTDIDREIRRLFRLNQAELVVVDYVQLVSNPGHATREEAISETSKRFKNFARDFRKVVLTASQLNDEGQLRDSRAIGHHADTLLFIGDEEITVGKVRRNAKETSFPAHLRGSIYRFVDPNAKVPEAPTLAQATF